MRLDTITLWEDEQPRDGALNMAVDESMLLHAREPWLRVYRWSVPSVSIGFSQKESHVPEKHRAWPVVRRWTGGGVVVHDDDWTYTIAIPGNHELGSGRIAETYRWIHEAMIAALAANGVTGCTLQSEPVSDGMGVCFVEPARYDVVRGDHKIAGAAQRRTKAGLLHQGSVQSLTIPPAFARCFAAELGDEVRVVSQDEAGCKVLPDAVHLAASKYSQPSWLHERRGLAT